MTAPALSPSAAAQSTNTKAAAPSTYLTTAQQSYSGTGTVSFAEGAALTTSAYANGKFTITTTQGTVGGLAPSDISKLKVVGTADISTLGVSPYYTYVKTDNAMTLVSDVNYIGGTDSGKIDIPTDCTTINLNGKTIKKLTTSDTVATISNVNCDCTIDISAHPAATITYAGGKVILKGADNTTNQITASNYSAIKSTAFTTIDSAEYMVVTFGSNDSITIPTAAVNKIYKKGGSAAFGDADGVSTSWAYDGDNNKITLAAGDGSAVTVAPYTSPSGYPTTVQTIDASNATGNVTLTLGAAVTSVALKESTANTVTLNASTADVTITGTNAADTIFTDSKPLLNTSYNSSTKKMTVTFGSGDNAQGSVTFDVPNGATVNTGTATDINVYSGTADSNKLAGVSTLYSYDASTKTATFYSNSAAIDLATANLPDDVKILDLSKTTGAVTKSSAFTNQPDEIKVGAGGLELGAGFDSDTTVINLGNYNLEKSEYDGSKITLTYNGAKTVQLTGSAPDGFKYNDKSNTGDAVELSTMYTYTKSSNTIQFNDNAQVAADTKFPTGIAKFTNVGGNGSSDFSGTNAPTLDLTAISGLASSVTVELAANTPSDKAGTLKLNDSVTENVTVNGGYWTVTGAKNNDKITISSTKYGSSNVTDIDTSIVDVNGGTANGTQIDITDGTTPMQLIVLTSEVSKVSATLPTQFAGAISADYTYAYDSTQTNDTKAILTLNKPETVGSDIVIDMTKIPQNTTKIIIPVDFNDSNLTLKGKVPDTVQTIEYGDAKSLTLDTGGGANNMAIIGVNGALTWKGYANDGTKTQSVKLAYNSSQSTLKSVTNMAALPLQ